MLKKWLRMVPFILTVLLITTSCGSSKQTTSQGPQSTGYKDTKTMVLDILKTEDGKKAIIAAQTSAVSSSDGQIKLLSTGDSQHIQLAVKDVLTDTTNNKFLQTVITDPKFAGQFAKAIQKEMKQMQKDLMKDPEYQQAVISTLNSPDFEKMLLDTMKSPQYRQQTKTVMQESMQSPLFRLEVMNLMKKVLEEESMPKAKGAQAGGGGGGGGGAQKKKGKGGQKDQESSAKQ
ncbi:spore gernimation protein [Paenibacillus piri]|uniref:Spore gernimation protein n=1 Tax=Paenibacillus piri TaxID=2547395 RepID=A0A4R5KAF4_9BACL|nr:spore gernimation protein [Paenibacillus piri]